MINWKNEYNEHILEADSYNEYPYAGYTKLLQKMYEATSGLKKILFLGIGTKDLVKELYKNSCDITVIESSEKILSSCKKDIPNCKFIHHDIEKGFPILENKFDAIISLYYMENLDFGEKIDVIKDMQNYLELTGKIIIGDIAFENLKSMEACAEEFEDLWDEDSEEGAFIISDFSKMFKMSFEKVSFCAGIIIIETL